MEFVLTFTKLKPYLQPWFYILGALKSRLIETALLNLVFVCFKDKSFTVVPFVMMKEVCFMGVKANPRFDVQKCCVVACKRNHFYF